MKDETWVDLRGYEGTYQISSMGRFRSVSRTEGRRWKGRILKDYRNKSGYHHISLSTLTHRMVAKAFIPNPLNLPCVNHKDGNKSNNTVSNLEWVTYSDNELHSYRVLGKKITPSPRYALDNNKSQPVAEYDQAGKFLRAFPSFSAAEKFHGSYEGMVKKHFYQRKTPYFRENKRFKKLTREEYAALN